jgi:hypothetical protein
MHDRESIIEQLVLITGYNRSVFEKITDEALSKELEKHYA